MEQSMFGADASTVRQQLENQFLANNSSLDLGAMSARAGYSLGTGLSNLAGFEHPQIREAKAVQEAVDEVRKSGVSMMDPAAYYRKMAGVFGAKGLTKQAEAAAMKALEFEDKLEERSFKKEDRQAQLQIKAQELAIKKAQLEKELEKAKQHAGFPAFQSLLKDAFANGQADQESIAEAIIEFNATDGNVEKALRKIRNKKEKSTEQWGEPVERNVNGKIVLQQQNLTTKEWKTLAGNEANITNSPRFSIAGPDQQMAWDLSQIERGKERTEQLDKQVRSLDNAYTLLNSRTPAASSMGIRVLAGAIQSGTLSKGDVAAVDNTGSLFDRLQNYASKGITGTPSESVTKDLQLGIKVLRAKVAKDREDTLGPYRRSAERAKRDPKDFFPDLPPFPGDDKPGIKPSTKAIIEDLKRNR